MINIEHKDLLQPDSLQEKLLCKLHELPLAQQIVQLRLRQPASGLWSRFAEKLFAPYEVHKHDKCSCGNRLEFYDPFVRGTDGSLGVPSRTYIIVMGDEIREKPVGVICRHCQTTEVRMVRF